MPLDESNEINYMHYLISMHGDALHTTMPNHLLVQINSPDDFLELTKYLNRAAYYLVTMVANDERELEDGCFKLYYLFSPPTGNFLLTVEYVLGKGEETYPSIYDSFRAADPFERECYTLMGLAPRGRRGQSLELPGGFAPAYPPALYPLRRDITTAQLKDMIRANKQRPRNHPPSKLIPETGSRLVPVGPVHAGIIESGRFVFQLSGEEIEKMVIEAGYKHRGIERLFQTGTTLADGWRLAEQVTGDSSFAHSLAYCRAAELLAGVTLPEPAQLLRVFFLELERLYNHIGDAAALLHDVAFDLMASEIAIVRENLLRLNEQTAGHRLLRGLNRPGGIQLPHPLDVQFIRETISACLESFENLAALVTGHATIRERIVGTGILSSETARQLGITGLAARASGLKRNFYRNHSDGTFPTTWLHEKILALLTEHETESTMIEATAGDVNARLLTRLREIKLAGAIIFAVLERWPELVGEKESTFQTDCYFPSKNNFTFAIGYAEGWRGEIVYWLMQDKFGRIYRCKVRDPSFINWPALPEAVMPQSDNGRSIITLLPDFPLINKSFNLSFSAADL